MILNRDRRAEWMSFALACTALWLAGCGCNEGFSQDELDRAAKSKPPTAEQWAKVTQTMANVAQDKAAKERQWVKDHPEEAKRINAERARAGRPPLGGG